jgi:hypothetical protein
LRRISSSIFRVGMTLLQCNCQSQTIRNNHLIKEKMNLKKIYFTYLNIMSMQ